ncbi:MAG: galactose-1-phosphate uridylyltransferase [Patescibacteria group bacterium]|nr:galactose-1-phosphate uridylyltransferase [Patescibacteria group bacterium]
MKKSELRKDYIQDKYVIIAPRRGRRPHDIEKPIRVTPPKKEQCIFCPGKIQRAGTIVKLDKKTVEANEPWAIAVIKNRFPSVSVSNPKAYGRQEVVVETPDHLKEIEELPVARIAEILNVYAERTSAISKDKKINYILIFKNNGGAAGASLQHAHSQIFATQFLPPHLEDKSQKMQDHRLKYGDCVYCHVIGKERKSPRLVAEDKNIIAFCPWASLHNYEIWIMPKRHVDNISLLTAKERVSFAKILKSILGKINDLDLPYNYYFHQVIHDRDQHFYMKVTPRGSVWAGVEIGSGLIINPIPPEEAAKFYRK